jgi:DNA-binding CsgD family transcriptional regulator
LRLRGFPATLHGVEWTSSRSDPSAELVGERRRRLLSLIDRLRRVLGPELIERLDLDASTDTAIEQALEDSLFALRDWLEGDRPGDETTILAMDLLALRDEIRRSVYMRQLKAVTDLQHGLARLRAVTSVEDVIEQGPRVACESCGFQAAVLMRVSGSDVIPASAWSERDPKWFPKVRGRLVGVTGDPLGLSDLTLEREMMRRRRPFLVRDAMNDDAPMQELRRLTGVQSYVAAPIMPEDRIIAFMYAIHFDVALDIVDRDLLWAFAEGYGYALERTILRSRVDEQSQLVMDLVRAAERKFTTLASAGLDLVVSDGDQATEPVDAEPAPQFAGFGSAASKAHGLLSRRELEVMELLAEGATNRMIAERLVIAEATAKAHVAQILRKLGARNRAGAVTRYVQLLQQH